MADKLDSEVRYFLGPSEDVKITLETIIVPRHVEEDHRPQRSPESDQKNRRVLAVVTHQNQSGEDVEGSIFIFKYNPTVNMDARLQVHRVYPIVQNFLISMAQPNRHQESGDFKPNRNSPLIQSPSELILTIWPGQNGAKPLTLSIHDVKRLQLVLAECKRLKEIADSRGLTDKSFLWLAQYTSKHTPASLLSATPVDLRITIRPLYTRLSLLSTGMLIDDLANIEIIRNDWVQTKAMQEMQSAEKVDVRIRVGTFNVNGKMPSQDLASWVGGHSMNKTEKTGTRKDVELLLPLLRRLSSLSLGEIDNNLSTVNGGSVQSETPLISTQVSPAAPSSSSTVIASDDDPDMLVLGFQELDLSAEALLYSTSTTREDAWCLAVFAGLGEKGFLYEKLVSKQLVGMLLLVIVKKSIRSCFSDIKVTAAGAGIMGLMGNKGGTAVRLTLTPPSSQTIPNPCPTVLTFMNTHLAASDEMVDRRNADFHDLGRRLRFDNGSSYDSDGNLPSPISVYESDVLIWLGDLNYRLDLQDADVRELIASDMDDKVEMLLKFDQLKNSQRNKKAFDNFVEHQISHIPTYRFSTGILTDDMGFDRKRKPAWTDRILHMSTPSVTLQQLLYTSHPEITMSDHRPVSAEFSLQLGVIDVSNYGSIVHKLYHAVSGWEESDGRPKVKLESNTVNFGQIRYRQRISRTLEFQNQGDVPCAFYFVPQGSEGTICPQWLRVTPMTGLLLPNDKATINFTAYVDNDSASKLNFVSKGIEHTLILHTVLGQDYFITVSGEYQYTCFATSLSQLTRLPGHIRDLENSEALLSERLAINAPREVMRLVNWMMTNSIDVDGLFISPAEEHLVTTIRKCLDTGADFPKETKNDKGLALAFAQTLLQLLNSLSEPVIPVSLHARCAQITSRDEAFELLDELPSEAVNVWISITAFLHFITQQSTSGNSESNTSKAESLATVFAPVFLRDNTLSYPPISPMRKREFLLYFIS